MIHLDWLIEEYMNNSLKLIILIILMGGIIKQEIIEEKIKILIDKLLDGIIIKEDI